MGYISQMIKAKSDRLNPSKARRPKPGDAIARKAGLSPTASNKEIAARLGTSGGKVAQMKRELNGKARAAHLAPYRKRGGAKKGKKGGGGWTGAAKAAKK